MFIIKERYPLYYFQGDYSDLVPVPHETFFEEKDGQIYSQFYPGQLIPREVFDRIFGNTTEVEKPIEIEEVSIEEVFIPEVAEVSEVIEVEVETDPIVEVEKEVVNETVEVEIEQPSEKVSQPKAKAKKKK